MSTTTTAGKRGRGRPALPPEAKSAKRTITFYLAPETQAALAARQAEYPKGRSDTLRYALSALDALVDASLPTMATDEWKFLLFYSRGIVPLAYFGEGGGDRDSGEPPLAEGNPDVVRLTLADAVEYEASASGLDRDALAARVEALTPAGLLALHDVAKRVWARVDLAAANGVDDDFDAAVADLVPADHIAS